MRCFIGLGSNIGDRKKNIEKAAQKLIQVSFEAKYRLSPLYETPALVPNGAPVEWNQSYLNAVLQIEWNDSARALFELLKKTEKELGRIEAARWAPRVIDLDLLLFGDEGIREEGLCVPHPGLLERSFVLDPLKDLAPQLYVSKSNAPVVVLARKLKNRAPWIMGIINITPDSFSDGGEVETLKAFESKLQRMEECGVHAVDIGAESTRPGACVLSLEEEKLRLKPVFKLLRERYRHQLLRPYLSVDTRRPEIAEMALEYGFDCINDVSGLADSRILNLLSNTSCDYVLMHSLTIPADSKSTLPQSCDPVLELKSWLEAKLRLFEQNRIDLGRVIFDPGIGFGKTAQQSISILERMEEFADLPVRLLVGHSRKSFMKTWGLMEPKSRDAATLSLSLELRQKGVDILRVHDFKSHAIAFRLK